ncbi:hypothetical protein I553_10721 [Mycobacterium xenopi 4042]|uniref:Uncharacterized protein n=2 Tax=Mycobacteriaceae TaxID=1762 RepID=X8DAP0_MYCXE|nr:hypothetical protein I552_0477 [Mycobacterium xenopi 3993]EUA65424.1 hypothetical protein I553_10721 [Mycobacterium xenopi 4042]
MMRSRRLCGVWDSIPSHAGLVGDIESLRWALVAYVRAHKAARRDHTIHLLTGEPPAVRAAS